MRTLRTGTIVELANHTDLLSKDGSRYHISDSAAPIFDKQGKIIGAILIFHDVTETYEQRDKLRLLVSQLEAASALTQSASFSFDSDSKEMEGSKLIPELWPIRDGKAIHINEFVYPEDIAKVRKAWECMLAGDSESETIDYRVEKDGEIRYYRAKTFVSERRRKSIKAIGVIQDVTEIMRNAAKLNDTRNLWRLVMDSIPVLFYAKDIDNGNKIAFCNTAFSSFFKMTPEEIKGVNEVELFFD